MKISVDTEVLNEIMNDARNAAMSCEHSFTKIKKVAGMTLWTCFEKNKSNENLMQLYNKQKSLSEACNQLAVMTSIAASEFNSYVKRISGKYSFLDAAIAANIAMEYKLKAPIQATVEPGKKTEEIITGIGVGTHAGITATAVAVSGVGTTIVTPKDLYERVQKRIREAKKSDKETVDEQNNINQERIQDSSVSPKYEHPIYATEKLEPGPDGVYGNYVRHSDGSWGSVEYFNRPGELSCTYYTLRKLNERGLSYPCVKGPFNGKDWINCFDHESGLPNATGIDALDQIVNGVGLPQDNIVVSYSANNEWGHVLLIDKMYRDKNGVIQCVFSDNGSLEAGNAISSVNGTNPQRTLSIEEMRNLYGYSLLGAAVMGAGNR